MPSYATRESFLLREQSTIIVEVADRGEGVYALTLWKYPAGSGMQISQEDDLPEGLAVWKKEHPDLRVMALAVLHAEIPGTARAYPILLISAEPRGK